MKKVFLYSLMFILALVPLFSQKEFNNWIFGYNAGITFNTPDGKPISLEINSLTTEEGCASVSDRNGNLLFYTNGETVWNNKNDIIPNGADLEGSIHSAQSALIVQKPGDTTLYYIFTVGAGTIIGSVWELDCNYSVVNTKKGGVVGSYYVEQKNSPLFQSSTEKLISARHKNGKYAWVIAHESLSNNFRAYLVTENGVETNPVISSTGYDLSLRPEFNSCGQMKVSAKGDKLAMVVYGQARVCEVYDFDNATGKISNPVRVAIPKGHGHGNDQDYLFGLEFSPDASKLYITTPGNDWGVDSGYIYQVDLLKDVSNPDESVTTLDYSRCGQMQLGPDGRIYIIEYLGRYLHVIDKPNLSGTGCNYIRHGLNLKGMNSHGITNNLLTTKILIVKAEVDTPICENEPLKLKANQKSSVEGVSYHWTGPGGFESFEQNPVINNPLASMSGWYKVEVTCQDFEPGSDSVYVTIKPKPVASLSPDKTIILCSGEKKKIKVNGSAQYKYLWSTGEVSDEIEVVKEGSYSVNVLDTTGCSINLSTTVLEAHNDDIQISESIDFGITCTGEEVKKELIIKNKGKVQYYISKIYLKNTTDNYIIDNYPDVINPDEEIKVGISFKSDVTGEFNNEIVMSIDKPCVNSLSTNLKTTTISKLLVSAPEMEALTGSLINIPVYIEPECGKELPGNITIEAEIELDAVCFYPIVKQINGVTNKGIVYGKSVIHFISSNPAREGSRYLLGSVRGWAMLADTDKSPIKITKTSVSSDNIILDRKDGTLLLTNVCSRNLNQFLFRDNMYVSVTPNPADNEGTISISGNENGTGTISVYTMTGIRIEEREINKISYTESINLDLESYSGGMYIVVATIGDKVSRARLNIAK